MGLNLKYYTTSIIHLSLEDYHNAGISPDKTKELIESIVYPWQTGGYSSGYTLKCDRAYINANWNVEVMTTDPHKIDYIVRIIKDKLNRHLGIESSRELTYDFVY